MIDKRQRNVALLVAVCLFMEIFDGTIVTTSARVIGADLHVSSVAIGLAVTAYFITVAVLIPLSGWMVARFGTRKVFLSAIVIFTFASFLCSTADNLGELVATRVLQGFGGAMMVPVGRLAVLSRTAKADIMRTVSYIVWPALLAPVVAPLAGGFITTYAGWRWLFLINVPLGIIALIIAVRIIPSASTTAPPRLDWLGVLLTCTGIGGLAYTAHLLAEPNAAWGPVIAIGGVSALLLALDVWHLLRVRDPLVELRTLRFRSFRTSFTEGSLFIMSLASVPFLLPLLFENVFRWSPVKAGALVVFVFVGNIAIKPATTPLLNRFGFRTVLIADTLVMAATMVAAGLLTRATPLPVIMLVTMLGGAARSLGATGYTTLSFSDIPSDQMRHANSLASTAQQLSLGLGVAAATLALRVSGSLGGVLGDHQTQARTYSAAFIMLALLPLACAAGATRLQPDVGGAVRRIRAKPAG